MNMAGIILDGRKLSEAIAKKIKSAVIKLPTRPGLAIIQVGDLQESNIYIKHKKNVAEKVGIFVEHIKYPEKTKESRIIADIRSLNKNKRIHGIMVQLPLPAELDQETILESIDPQKDVDGLTALNIRRLLNNREVFIPAVVRGTIELLKRYRIRLERKKVTVVGHSSLVGRPLALALLNRSATVTICHKKTKNLAEKTRAADILISAVGQPNLIRKKHVSKNQIVIDIGITMTDKGKVVGDVDFKSVKKIVRALTPVPGGVGPVTVVSLFENLLDSPLLKRSKI